MATIKPIEGSSVHQIQSGQVIVDLCSVVKELVENALDASATSLEVRFKSNGLDSIEVSDNGSGISPDDFESIALKHYTSKLAKYDDLTSLTTFGFRGEALSSLCALSGLSVVTSRASDAPKGTKLEFETSGRVKGKSVVASQKGTTVTVEQIFRNLPVRRRELEKNIKREYGKVLGLLHAYACISTGVRFSVSNVPTKGKKVVVFSTKSNPTTRENIANVYGAKTLLALIPLDLSLELMATTASTQNARNWSAEQDAEAKKVRLVGHISRPVIGEGRQTPDRQMFFVNSRPCALPQVSKAINEVYKSYNVTQSPFIFANLELDTNAYDVNVSPDKRTILLHDQTALLEALKESLIEVFEGQEQRVPQAATPTMTRLPSFKPPQINQELRQNEEANETSEEEPSSQTDESAKPPISLIRRNAEGIFESREDVTKSAVVALAESKKRPLPEITEESGRRSVVDDEAFPDSGIRGSSINPEAGSKKTLPQLPRHVQDFNARMGIELSTRKDGNKDDDNDSVESIESSGAEKEDRRPERDVARTSEEGVLSVSNTPQKVIPGAVPSAFDRMRPKRAPQEVATVTIGNQTVSMTLGTPEAKKRRIHTPGRPGHDQAISHSSSSFRSGLEVFAADSGKADIDTMDSEDDTEDDVASLASSDTNVDETLKDIAKEETTTGPFLASEDDSDDEYMDESEKRAREEARIAKMIKEAEDHAAQPTRDNVKHAANALKSRIRKDSTLHLMSEIDTSIQRIEQGLQQLTDAINEFETSKVATNDGGLTESSTLAEERLALTVSKSDFGRMRIIGQFNLGFILATRDNGGFNSELSDMQSSKSNHPHDELFIIDQHASDEKYNFERLQSQTIVQNQRLVHPKQLDLTAIEEEVILNNPDALLKNGFEVTVDTSGDLPVGQRCKLTSLPMSREVTFTLSDLEELLALLSEHQSGGVPRPSKARRMFAMRACRSSIMVGKTLTQKQMEKVVRHMGELDKPWNCPHGRPTMRHLFSLDGFEPWEEGGGLAADEGDGEGEVVSWAQYLEQGRESGLLEDAE